MANQSFIAFFFFKIVLAYGEPIVHAFFFLFVGDTESLWKIEKLRSDSMKQHTLATGFSCAKVENPSTPLFDLTINFDYIAVMKLICFVCNSL
jgi:hypothetical protein